MVSRNSNGIHFVMQNNIIGMLKPNLSTVFSLFLSFFTAKRAKMCLFCCKNKHFSHKKSLNLFKSKHAPVNTGATATTATNHNSPQPPHRIHLDTHTQPVSQSPNASSSA